MPQETGLGLGRLLDALGPGSFLVAGRPVDPDRVEVTWAHVNEMVDPSPWLAGGEILLTTGLLLPTNPDELGLYIGRIKEAGVAALGISTGRTLAHPHPPPGLVDAADKAGLPLISIAETLPLESVVQTVAAFIYDHKVALATSAARVHHSLTQAVSRGADPTQILALFEAELDITAHVFDAGGALIWGPAGSAEQVAAVRAVLLTEVRPHDRRLHVTEIGAKHVEVHALVLGSGFVGAYLTLVGRCPFPTVARHCMPLLHKAIDTALLPPRHIDKHQLSWRAALVDSAFRFSLTDAQLDERLAAAGYRNTVVRAFVLTHRLEAHAMDLARFYFLQQCETLLVNIRPHRIDCLLLNPVPEAGTDRGVREVAVAGGPEARQRELSATVAAAHRAANRNQQQALATHDELGTLIRSLPDTEREQFVHAVLHDLLDFEQVAGLTDLSTTLAVYLANLGALEPTAAALGVHRHTVRNRLRRIGELTGRDPDNVDDRLALQLALALSGRTRNTPN